MALEEREKEIFEGKEKTDLLELEVQVLTAELEEARTPIKSEVRRQGEASLRQLEQEN